MIEDNHLDDVYKETYYLNYFYKMLEFIPPELLEEGKKLKEKQVKKYIKQLGELKDELQASVYEIMLDSILGRRYGYHLPFYFNIKNENDFHISFEVLLYIQTKFDLEKNVLAVNQIAMIMVRYYGELIIKYGDEREKAFFVNNIKLLKLNKLIHD